MLKDKKGKIEAVTVGLFFFFSFKVLFTLIYSAGHLIISSCCVLHLKSTGYRHCVWFEKKKLYESE